MCFDFIYSVLSETFLILRRNGRNVFINVAAERFFIYLFIRIAGISYGRFMAVRFGFNLSTYIQNCW